MRNFSIELLKQSPSKALRACASLSQVRVGEGQGAVKGAKARATSHPGASSHRPV